MKYKKEIKYFPLQKKKNGLPKVSLSQNDLEWHERLAEWRRLTTLSELLLKDDNRIYIAIAVAICNESYAKFAATLKSLIRNIRFLLQRFESVKPKNIVIFLIQDGKEKLTPEFLKQANGRILNMQVFESILQGGLHDLSMGGCSFTENSHYTRGSGASNQFDV